jgi:hypothetical protein
VKRVKRAYIAVLLLGELVAVVGEKDSAMLELLRTSLQRLLLDSLHGYAKSVELG